MVILLNKNCCGGKGLEKWNRVKDYILNSETDIIQSSENDHHSKLKKFLEKGETQFLVAGGDGTVNYMLNILIETATPEQLKKIEMGAIGIGSSNDFHKPFSTKIGEIPVCIDFQNVYLRDVGLIKYTSDARIAEKYFLINASIGITAEANSLFNNPNWFLRALKRINTKSAILFSAIKAILFYKNFDAEINFNGDKLKTYITNLGMTKNPHFSGDFSYDCEADYANGKFDIHLAYDMNMLEVLKLMHSLTKNCFSKLRKTKSWQNNGITITSEKNFVVEYDGEIVHTNKVEFKVLKNFIKVCGNGKSI